MLEAELIITLRKQHDSIIKLFSFVHEGIEYVLTESQIKDYENRYGVEIMLKESKTLAYDLEPKFDNLDSISKFFSHQQKK